MDLKRTILFTMLIQTVKMEIEPCTNSMWTQSVINNCLYWSNGRHWLSLQMTLQNLTCLQATVNATPSESKQLMLWCNLTSRLLPSLAILDESVKSLSQQFNRIRQFLEWKPTSDSDAAFRQSKNQSLLDK